MPKRTYKILRFDGGINNNAHPRDIADNELVEAIDIDVSSMGIVRPSGHFGLILHSSFTIGGGEDITTDGTGFFAFSSDYNGFRSGTVAYNASQRVYYLVENGNQISIMHADTFPWPTTNHAIDLNSVLMYAIDGNVRFAERDHSSAKKHKIRGFHAARSGNFPGSSYSPSELNDNRWYTEDAEIKGCFPLTQEVNGSATFKDVAYNALMLNTEYAAAWTGSNQWYGFINTLSNVDTKDANCDGTTTSGTSDMEWGVALRFKETANGGGSWMPSTDVRYKFYVTTMYDDHTQESLPQLFRMFDTDQIHGGQNFHNKTATKEIAFRDGDSATLGENVAVNFSFVVNAGLTSGYSYVFGGPLDGSTDGNFRISGVRVYWASNEDGYSSLWQIFDCKFDEGTKVIGKDGAGTPGSGYTPFIDDDEAAGAKVNIPVSSTWKLPPRIIQYAVVNGHYPTDTIAVDSYKTAVLANRRLYIGNVKQNGVVHGDRMLKSPVNQFDKFPEINSIDVAINDGDEIIHLAEYADRLLQFKKNALYIINIADNVEFLEAEHKFKGVNSPGSVCKTDYGVAWVNGFGCYLYDGQVVSDLLEKNGQKIINHTEWREFLGASGSDSTNKKEKIIYNPSRKSLIVVNGNDSYIYDLPTKSWVKSINNITTQDGNLLNDPSDGTPILCNTLGAIYEYQNIATSLRQNWTLVTKFFDLGEPSQRKKIHFIYITHNETAADSLGLWITIIASKATGGQDAGEISAPAFCGFLHHDESDSDGVTGLCTQKFTLPSVDLIGNPIKFNNVQSLQLRISSQSPDPPGGTIFTGAGSAVNGGSEAEIHDITVIFRPKAIK